MAKFVLRKEGRLQYTEIQVVEFDGTLEELQKWYDSDGGFEWCDEHHEETNKWELYDQDDYGDGATVTADAVDDWKDKKLEDGRNVLDLTPVKLPKV